MNPKDKKRMISMGQWIERYLNPGIKPHEFKKLIKEAKKILNISYPVDYNKTWISEMEKIRFIDDQGFENLSYFEEYCIDSFGQEMPLHPIVSPRYNIEPFEPGDIRGYFRMDILNMLLKRKDIESIFQTIYKTNRPWNYLFADIQKNETTEEDTIAECIIGLINEYEEITDSFVVKKHRLEKAKTFRYLGCYYSQGEEFEGFYNLHFDSIISNMILNFLDLGGQDHFKFCDYCGRFTVIKRKGSKKFCSDLCRVKHHY
ncbi:hypothetical protein [Desulfotignum balticum]|uniref:hypothetical protein n=1 Tax=Desulfotignum balticum TaxID=115781 RepID=UPI000462C542|nr:hypothetical protein [Desulfotignum balticum]